MLNAANEVAVAAFLAGQIGFMRIAANVERVLAAGVPCAPSSLDDVLAIDHDARIVARELLELA